MPTKSDISVLNLQFWMKYWTEEESGIQERKSCDHVSSILPIFNRDGWYYNRKTKLEWYEYKGEAFLIKHQMFSYTLSTFNAKVLTTREVKAYREMINLNPPKHIKSAISKILYEDSNNKSLREIRLNSYRIRRYYAIC